MFQRCLLTDDDVGRLGEAVLTVLDKVGALYQNEDILNALDANGAKVDRTHGTAIFPREMVREFLEALRKETAGAQGDDSGHREFHAPSPSWLFHQLSQYAYDDEKGEPRLGNRQDYIELLKLGDVVHGERGVGHCLLLVDVPAPVEPLEATLLQFEHVHRPTGAYVQDMRQVPYLVEMEEISGIEGLHWLANVGFSSPLRFGKDVAERFVYKVTHDRPASLYIMTVSGAGTPVTVAGTAVIGAAEFLANWMAARALNPSVRLNAGAWIATPDMRSGGCSYSAPDAMVRNFALREFMRRWTGATIGVGGGEYCAAKAPGLYAALEKAYSAMTVAAFTGSLPGVGSGHLDGGLTISGTQFLLDREMADVLKHLEGPIDVSDETIGLDTILEVGHAENTNYMATEHTLRHFRSALWLPELLERTGWMGPESEERALDRARARRRELLATYEKPELDEDKLARLRAVVERARRELL